MPDPHNLINKYRNQRSNSKNLEKIFREEELNGVEKENWPHKIDESALTFVFFTENDENYIIGDSDNYISKINFGSTVGETYIKGINEVLNNKYDFQGILSEHSFEEIGDLVYKLNEFRYDLEDSEEIKDLNRGLEALFEKLILLSASNEIDLNLSLNFKGETVTDLISQLFAKEELRENFDLLLSNISEKGTNLASLLDRPVLVTPLWDHQKDALDKWKKNGHKGYVDMATATGKTVLGISAIALNYGYLHPKDKDLSINRDNREDYDKKILVVVHNNLLIQQWKKEFDKHLDILEEKTELDENKGSINLSWGNIEFRTTQYLRENIDSVPECDLVILDEAHKYGKGSKTGVGWRQVFEKLNERSESMLAMSGSINEGFIGSNSAEKALKNNLNKVKEFNLEEARKKGVIADFSWEILYSNPEEENLKKLVRKNKNLKKFYDPDANKFNFNDLDLPENLQKKFDSLSELRNKSQTKKVREVIQKSTKEDVKTFDEIAREAKARRTIRWNQTTSDKSIIDLIDQHVPEQKCIILTRSYKKSKSLGQKLRNKYNDEVVLVPESSSKDQIHKINSFNDMDEGIIVGVKSLLGLGVDMPDAEVAIDVAGSGGVNPSLIQHIGRVLRNPSGDKEAKYYRLTPVPNQKALIKAEDGKRIIRNALKLRNFGYNIKELPNFACENKNIKNTIENLERSAIKKIEEKSPEKILNQILEKSQTTNLIKQNFKENAKDIISKIKRNKEQKSIICKEFNSKSLLTQNETKVLNYLKKNKKKCFCDNCLSEKTEITSKQQSRQITNKLKENKTEVEKDILECSICGKKKKSTRILNKDMRPIATELNIDLENQQILNAIKSQLEKYKHKNQEEVNLKQNETIIKDPDGKPVLIRIKTEKIGKEIIGDILTSKAETRKNLNTEKIKTILIGNQFSKDLKIAVKEIPNLKLAKYQVQINLSKLID